MKLWLIISGIAVVLVGLFVIGNKGSATPESTTSPASSLANMVGKPAPGFTLKDYNGKKVELSQFKGKKVVLFFSEGIMCYPACWNEIAALGKNSKLNNDKVVTLSIVPDTASDWSTAVKKMPELGRETILMDTDKAVSTNYDMMQLPSSMHTGSKPGHTYLILDENGIVRHTFDDPNMGIHDSQLEIEVGKI